MIPFHPASSRTPMISRTASNFCFMGNRKFATTCRAHARRPHLATSWATSIGRHARCTINQSDVSSGAYSKGEACTTSTFHLGSISSFNLTRSTAITLAPRPAITVVHAPGPLPKSVQVSPASGPIPIQSSASWIFKPERARNAARPAPTSAGADRDRASSACVTPTSACVSSTIHTCARSPASRGSSTYRSAMLLARRASRASVNEPSI